MVPQKRTLRRAHPKQRTCWEWDAVCNKCGLRVVEDWHDADKEMVEDFLQTGKI